MSAKAERQRYGRRAFLPLLADLEEGLELVVAQHLDYYSVCWVGIHLARCYRASQGTHSLLTANGYDTVAQQAQSPGASGVLSHRPSAEKRRSRLFVHRWLGDLPAQTHRWWGVIHSF
jgi:hypothetical protein